MDILAIKNEAEVAANLAQADFLHKHGEMAYCGFAWVTVSEKASTKLGRALKTVGFTKAYGGGLQLWNPGGSFTQSMDIKETGAQAYADTLKAHGITAYMGSRAD